MVDYQIRPVMVEVKGVPKVLDTKGITILELFLENKRRAGGDTAEFDYSKLARGKVYVTYSSPEVAAAVAKNVKLSVPHPEYDITVTTYTPPPEVPKKVRVTGLSTTIPKENLELFFENFKKSGGGDMEEDMTFRKKNTEAIITYKDQETAASVLQKRKNEGPFHFSGCTMDVLPVRQHPIDKRRVQLSGIAERVNREMLELFVENKNKSGGGDFHDLQVYPKRGTALVTFKEVADACEVVERGRNNKLEISKTRLTAEHYVPPSDSEEEEEEEKAEERRDEADHQKTASGSTSLTGSHGAAMSEGTASCDGVSADPPADDGCPSRCVEVTGVPRELTKHQKDNFEMLFENLAKDQHATFDYDKLKKGKVYITFTSPGAAEEVAKKVKVDLLQPRVTMSVCLFSQPPIVPNKIRLVGLKPSVSDQSSIQLFFENGKRTGGGDIEHFQFKRKGKEAAVTYKNSKHASAVLQTYAEKGPFEYLGCSIAVREVREATPDGRSVLLENIGDGVTFNILEMYLVNHKRSGGGNIMKLEMKPPHRAIVTFQTADIAKTVMKKSATGDGLQLSNARLFVRPYVPESSSEEEEEEQAPEAAGGTAAPQVEAARGSAVSRVKEAAPPTPGFLPGFYLFTGIPGSFDLDTFELLVENKAKVQVKSMTKGDEENRDNILVRIDVSQNIDVTRLTSTLQSHKQLREHRVCVERVKVPECVLVENVQCKMDEEMLELFLEGQAGGAFETIEVKKYSSPRRQGMVVCFSDHAEADRFYKHTHEYKEQVFRKVFMIEDFGPWSKG